VLNIVLVEPEIPPNTGNVSRLCAGLGAILHLVGPLGFSLDDRYLRRAGLDYWEHVRLERHDSLEAMLARHGDARLVLTSSTASVLHTEWAYQPGDFLVFGKESAGLPREWLSRYAGQCVRIPHWGPVRSLNLSNAVAVVAYEAARQLLERGQCSPPIPRAADKV